MTESGAPLVAVTALPGAGGAIAVAAALAVAWARTSPTPRAVVLCEVGAAVRRRPTIVSSPAARELEAALAPDSAAAARGALCWVATDDADWRAEIGACRSSGAAAVVAALPAARWRDLLSVEGEPPPHAAVVRADLPGHRPLAGLLAIDLRTRGMPAAFVTAAPSMVATRRALAGIEPGGELGRRSRRLAARLRRRSRDEAGQALPLLLGLAAAALVSALALALLGAAATGGTRLQRAADLAAISAARSMRDDYPRLVAPARDPSGQPNPAHLRLAAFRARARAAALEAVRANGFGDAETRVGFPDGAAAPVQVRVVLGGRVTLGANVASERARAVAVARAEPAAGVPSNAPVATGGGYAGRLAYRQGEAMRPDVAPAFDRLDAAARRAGIVLVITSAFRSDAEQAALFAANPDPHWVAPPGTSLHRCATELDLGPAAAYAWLAANALRFGFLKRYSWEPWHYGYSAGPAPCSPAGEAVAAEPRLAGGGLPGFTPPRWRDAIAAAASRWNVQAALIAAQLFAESGFNPLAVSPAGARGIAQFMPDTAAAYGLADPFDPVASIGAQAHLMHDLLEQFGSPALALAAYNAGPGPVAACNCVPAIPETAAYVTRILGLLGGAGVAAPPELEVRLVR